MNYSQHVYQIIFDRVEDAVGEPGQKCAAYTRNNFCVQKWDLFKALKLKLKSKLKFRAQPIALLLKPIERFANFANGSTGKLQAVRHEPLFICAFT